MAKRKIADLWLRKVLQILYQRRTVTRPEIIQATGLNSASVSHATRLLLHHGTILKMGDLQTDGGGRRREVFSLNREAAYFIAVDLEGERIRFGLLNLKSDICCRWDEERDSSESLDVRKLFAGMSRVVRSLDAEQRQHVIAVGISYPGLLDEHGGLTAVNLGWNEYPIKAELKEKGREWEMSDIPTFLEPHRYSALLAERLLGCARGAEDILLLFAEHGIGIGIYTGGRRVQGWRKMAGEIGHITIDPASQERCRCGKLGCLETVASPASVIRNYALRTGRNARVTEIYDRARDQEAAAVETVERAARALGLALSYAVSLLNPQVVVLGGDLTAGEDLFLPIIRSEIARNTLPGLMKGVTITCSTLGLDMRLKGAGAFAFRKSLSDPTLLKKICSPVLERVSARS